MRITDARWVAALALVACGGAVAPDGAEPTGTARLALSDVPADVACVRVEIVGATRSVERRLDVAAGAQLDDTTLDALPTGRVLATGDAYAVGCAAVDGASPTWTAAPVSATLSAASVTPIALVFTADGRADVSATFDAGAD